MCVCARVCVCAGMCICGCDFLCVCEGESVCLCVSDYVCVIKRVCVFAHTDTQIIDDPSVAGSLSTADVDSGVHTGTPVPLQLLGG